MPSSIRSSMWSMHSMHSMCSIKKLHPKWLSMFLSIPVAFILAPVLVQVPWVNYFLVFSVFSHFENLFLLTAISVYGLAQLVVFRLRHGHWRAVTHRVFFYCVSAAAVLVVGLVSLALLWVVPMALLIFAESGRSHTGLTHSAR